MDAMKICYAARNYKGKSHEFFHWWKQEVSPAHKHKQMKEEVNLSESSVEMAAALWKTQNQRSWKLYSWPRKAVW